MEADIARVVGDLSAIIALHYGPGPHPNGTPQQAHAGDQLMFDFGQQPKRTIDAEAEAERVRQRLLDAAARYEQRVAAARKRREVWAAKARMLYDQLYDADNQLRPGMTTGPDNALFGAWRDATSELYRSEDEVFRLLAAREEKLFDVIRAGRPASFDVATDRTAPREAMDAIRRDWEGLGDELQRSVRDGLRIFNRVIDAESVSDTAPRHIGFAFDPHHRRAHYDPPSNTVHLASTSRHISVIHELGHFIEYKTPGLRAYAQQFVERRTAGEVPIPLTRLVPNAGYADREMARPDRFRNPYIGKAYPDGATEAIAMGLEYMIADPVEFARADPEHWRFTYKVMRGLWRVDRASR